MGCSRGLCALAEGAQRFSGEPGAPAAPASSETVDTGKSAALTPADSSPEEGEETGNAEATEKVAGEDKDVVEGEAQSPSSSTAVAAAAAAAAATGRGGRTGSVGGSPEGAVWRRHGKKAGRTGATPGKAAELIAAGCKAGEAGAHPTQKMNGAVLEGLAWSLAGRCSAEGVS